MNFTAKLRKCISAGLFFFLFKISTFKLIFPTFLFEFIRLERSTLRSIEILEICIYMALIKITYQ